MMIEFLTPLAGGLLIGSAALATLFLLGRIAGVSGIVWGAISQQADNSWRWLFLLGLLAGPFLYHQLANAPYPAPSPLSWSYVLIGGLLVGFGVKMGSGCTSGHGVCGMGRLSVRSLVATLTFVGTGIVTVFLVRHVM
jgi:uncharacterized membrane protein YedE/YeeE